MARKVFLSFLGTTRYLTVRYYLSEECKHLSEPHHFVQYAIVKNICQNWNERDRIYIFLTEEAKNKNWLHPAQKEHKKGEYDGLSFVLKNLDYKPVIEYVDIDEGFTEQEVWNIFATIYSVLEPEDELYIDITNAFRSIPMILTVLLNYAKVTLNIKVKSIFYGAFEKLGPSYKVEQEIPIEKRFVPILELSTLSEIQDWTNAANAFVRFGNAEMLSELTNAEILPVLKETKGQDKEARSLRNFAKFLVDFTKDLRTNRGLEIYQGHKAKKLKQSILQIKDYALPALSPLLDHISSGLDNLDSQNDVINLFRAVKWTLNANLIQQAYSLLREAVITYVLWKSFPDDFKKLIVDENKRELVSSAFKIISNNIPEKNWSDSAKNNKDFINKIIDDRYPKDLIKEFDSLGNYRNDIMHAGLRKQSRNAEELIKKIGKSFDKIVEILNISL